MESARAQHTMFMLDTVHECAFESADLFAVELDEVNRRLAAGWRRLGHMLAHCGQETVVSAGLGAERCVVAGHPAILVHLPPAEARGEASFAAIVEMQPDGRRRYFTLEMVDGAEHVLCERLADREHIRLDVTGLPSAETLLALVSAQLQPASVRGLETGRPVELERGLIAYEHGDFFVAHEIWEAIWREHRADAERRVLQGIIQVAAAMHKAVAQHKPAPAARLLDKALAKLRDGPTEMWGIRIAPLVAECERARRQLLERGEVGLTPVTMRAAAS